ncbi:Uncharacterised protein [Psychrobacter phenylpyruvicus]|uniref:Uncharacterized protein n=1 Tax=Psychrobacter phenylpyruvicus TaxID=29432 RepID=A0A379LJE3_9GAMM|nr:Uncharacterised protein [Psychrobacter phenylpyruvicus]
MVLKVTSNIRLLQTSNRNTALLYIKLIRLLQKKFNFRGRFAPIVLVISDYLKLLN